MTRTANPPTWTSAWTRRRPETFSTTTSPSPRAWLPDGTEAALRAALAIASPALADLPLSVNVRHAQSNPLYWSSHAVVDRRFVVKFAWSELRAELLWREGVVLERLVAHCPSLPVPPPVVLHQAPALLATRLLDGVPLSREWVATLTAAGTTAVADELGDFLARLHGVDAGVVLAGLRAVVPTPQADTGALRGGFLGMVDEDRGATVLQWCDWVDAVLGAPSDVTDVLVHGDLHGYNQVWDRASSTLLAVVDFEGCGLGDPHFDLRYLPSNAPTIDLTLAVMVAYQRRAGQRLAVERVMAWHVLTALGDALWRTRAGIELPGGGTPTTYVDELVSRFDALGLC